MQAPLFDGLLFDPFSLFNDGFCPAEVGIGGCVRFDLSDEERAATERLVWGLQGWMIKGELDEIFSH